MKPFTVSHARYARGKMLVQTHDDKDGLKGRSAYLLEALNARYTHRERGYILSEIGAQKFQALYAAGYEARMRFFSVRDGYTKPALYLRFGENVTLAEALKAIAFKPQ